MIAFYHGTSLLSRIIRFRSWSTYSHVSYVRSDGMEVEALGRNGVTDWHPIGDLHKPGTEIEVYQVLGETAEQRTAVEEFLRRQIGKKYDWLGLFGFITRRDFAQNQDKWFCSELVFAAYEEARRPLLKRIPAWRVMPRDLVLSTELVLVNELWAKKPT